jgi:hypothetical protein
MNTVCDTDVVPLEVFETDKESDTREDIVIESDDDLDDVTEHEDESENVAE